MSDVSNDTVIATNTITARTLGNRAADVVNVLDYGAVLNGTTNDYTAFNIAYNATVNNGTILIPSGFDNVTPKPHSTGKNVAWKTLGTYDYGGSPAGTNPVTTFGDGDLFHGYWGGTYNFSKTINTATNGFANAFFRLNNSSGSQFSVGSTIGNLVATANSFANNSGYTWNGVFTLNSGANGGASSQDTNVASHVNRTNNSATWNYWGYNTDSTGLPGVQASSVFCEGTIEANGPELGNSVYNPKSGSRVFYHLTATPHIPASWVAVTSYQQTTAIIATTGGSYTYICTTSGTSGSSPPEWPTANSIIELSSLSYSSTTGLVTATTSVAFATGLSVGNQVLISISGCTPSAYNVAQILATISVISGSSTSFTYPLLVSPGTVSALGMVSTASVADGTAVWSFGASIAMQVSRAIDITALTGASIGTGVACSGTFYNAILDLSYATLSAYTDSAGQTSSPAAIRVAANMPIDFSANQTIGGQNVRTLAYNSTSRNLEYSKLGSAVFSISDTGAINSAGASFTLGSTITMQSGATYVLDFSGSSVAGINLSQGTFTGPAMRLAEGQAFSWEHTDQIQTAYNSGSLAWQVLNGGNVGLNVSINSGESYFSGGVGVGGSSGPFWKSGTGVPTYSAPRGSMYSRADGEVGSTLYVSQGSGTWNAVVGV